jgi:DNA-binding transcriptional LysR family regulator
MDWADRIGRRIRLRDLHIVMAVADCGSMTKAASQLAISHPVISKTISDLEHTLGVRLFDRTTQGVVLTPYGQALLKCGTTVFDEMRLGLKQIEFLVSPDAGELRIGSPEIAMTGLMPAIVERFSNDYPRVSLHVVMANIAMMQFQELRDRQIDLLIGRMPRPLPEDDLAVETLFDEPFVAVAGLGSRWARVRKMQLSDLIDERWVLPPYDSLPGALIMEIFREQNLQPPQAAVVSLSAQLTVSLIASGRFVGVLPNSVAQFNRERTGLRLLPIRLGTARFGFGIITVKNRTLSPLAQRFIDCAKDVASTIPNVRL